MSQKEQTIRRKKGEAEEKRMMEQYFAAQAVTLGICALALYKLAKYFINRRKRGKT